MRAADLALSDARPGLGDAAAAARGPGVELALSALVALLMTAMPVGLHLVAPPLALGFSVCAALAVASLLPRAIPLVILVSYCFQTTFVAMASPQARAMSDLEPMKIYNFVASVVMWAAVMARWFLGRAANSPFVDRLMRLTFAALAVIGVFFVAGLAFDARGAAIYMRNIGLPILLFQMCLVLGARLVVDLRAIVTIVLGALLVCGYIEMFALNEWFALTNAATYWDLAYAYERDSGVWVTRVMQGGPVVASIYDVLKTDFLNTPFLPGDIEIIRMQGPNFHAISYGYALATFGSFLALHGRGWMTALMIPLLLFASAKGAIVLLLATLVFGVVARFWPHPALPAAGLAVLGAYAVMAFVLGLRIGDYHVLGLIGGINGFLRSPIGHTLGQGGNLSTNFAELDWTKFQAGGAADFAIESAVGVLLYQLGVAAIALLALYFFVARLAWRLYRAFGAPALAWSTAAVGTILVNGAFQEEALFAPLAFAVIMAIVGLTLGSTDRCVAALAKRRDERPA